MGVPPHPMCDKLGRHIEARNTIVDFLGWLEEQGIFLCNRTRYDFNDLWMPQTETRHQLAHRYLGIDEGDLEHERRALLDYARQLTSGGKEVT